MQTIQVHVDDMYNVDMDDVVQVKAFITRWKVARWPHNFWMSALTTVTLTRRSCTSGTNAGWTSLETTTNGWLHYLINFGFFSFVFIYLYYYFCIYILPIHGEIKIKKLLDFKV